MPAAAVRRVGRIVLLVHLPVELSREEWAEHIEQLSEHLRAPEVTMLVVWTDGQLSAVQRQMVGDMHARLQQEGHAQPTAFTFTDSTLSRGVMTALRWLGVLESRAFPKAALATTMHAAGLMPAEVDALAQAVHDLERGLRNA